MLEIIQASQHSEIALVVMPQPAPASPPKSFWRRVSDNRKQIGPLLVRKALDTYYQRFLERHTYGRPSETPRDTRDLLAGVPVIEVDPIRTKWSDSFKQEDLDRIAGHQIDVFIRLGFRILRGGILKAARYGVWSYHHGDNIVNRGGPPGFWETMESWPETGSILQILTEDLDNGKVLSRTWSCTDWSSVLDNKRNYFWKTLSLMPRKLAQLHQQGPEAFFAQVEAANADPMLYSERLYTAPTNKEYARLLWNKTVQKAREIWRHRRYLDQWILMYDLRGTLSSSLWRYKKLAPPTDRFWADPHIVERDGHYYIFIEELLYATNRGHISVIKMDKQGRYSAPERVLERPYHLSYPYLFEYDGQLYMVPESAQNRTVELYRCVEFPHKWEFVHNLMEGVKVYDATLTFHNGKWWMFANMVEVPGSSSWDELFVFWADSPLSQQWTPHPANPVISDCKRARPAGRLF
ncbi:MAG TPA: hypothetical protein VFM48_10600, partial [Aquabacterium sp.]|nr:hypothetical protein [Aquabacterium sp.]